MGEEMNELQIWQGPDGLEFPLTVKEPNEIVKYAHYLTTKQKDQISAAFSIQAFDMAAEYAWRKGMVKLKETISTLGMKFIGEMLGREDFDEATTVDEVITDYTAIQLAEQLGVIGTTAALKLRQCNELVTHYFSKDADEEIDYLDALKIVKSSIQYILGEQNISIAIEFSKFRERLLSETLKIDDSQVEQIIGSPLFYLRTVMTILLSSVRNDLGAKLEHAVANLNLVLPSIWERLGENDKWHVGTAYRDTTAAGNTIASSGLKNALLKINGFDYVPENLRSITFINTAKQLLETHFRRNNFYNEPSVVKKLSNLGSTIPAPALVECMQAYLAVYLGNIYGISNDAAPIAEQELSQISRERWYYYFEKVIHNDQVILLKMDKNQVERFSDLLGKNNLKNFLDLPKTNQFLYNAIIKNDYKKAKRLGIDLYKQIKKRPSNS